MYELASNRIYNNSGSIKQYLNPTTITQKNYNNQINISNNNYNNHMENTLSRSEVAQNSISEKMSYSSGNRINQMSLGLVGLVSLCCISSIHQTLFRVVGSAFGTSTNNSLLRIITLCGYIILYCCYSCWLC